MLYINREGIPNMAYISQDPNTSEQTNTTNVLAPNAAPAPQNQAPATSAPSSISTSAPSGGYVSTGNPYGKYGTPGQPTAPAGTSASSRKTSSGPASGLQTNVQTYAQKNVASSKGLGSAVAGKLQNTSDIAKQNLAKVENKYQQGMEAATLANRDTAVQEAKTGFQEAATASGPERTFTSREATMYDPKKNEQGVYSAEDQALINANKAKVSYADGTSKEFDNRADAQAAITDFNKANPGFYTYGEEAKGTVEKDRLSEILNAEYKGPKQLSDISGYGDASGQIKEASLLQEQALKGRSKEELLNRTFAAPTGEYTKGSRLLDELLLGQGDAASTLKSTAEKLGSTPSGMINDEFRDRNKTARQQAVERANEISGVKEEARKALSETAAGRSQEVNNRVNDVIKDWDKYPTYFKDRFKGELEKHNVSSKKKQEYDTVAPQYANAVSAKNSLEQKYSSISQLNVDELSANAAIADRLNSRGFRSIGEFTSRSPAEQQAVGYISNLMSTLGQDITTVEEVGYDGRKNLRNATGSEIAQKVMNAKNEIASAQKNVEALQPQMESLSQYANYDPNALDVSLSQLEAESLGIQGGEGLYNILKEQGVDGLIKTAAYDKNKLVSVDEQAQLARLQNIAELANDYGVQGSGVNFTNQFNNRELAGQQNALSALDMDNFKKQLQGAEKNFRTDAAASNITGTGTGSGNSRGIFGRKRATATASLSQNFGDILKQGNATRNMYSDKGVNNDLLKDIIAGSKGALTNSQSLDTSNIAGQLANSYNKVHNAIGTGIDKAKEGISNFTGSDLLGDVALSGVELANKLVLGTNKVLLGSSAKAQNQANNAAQQNALANLQANLQNKINTSGLKNQLSVGKNAQQDAELFKLLGLLDTTNL